MAQRKRTELVWADSLELFLDPQSNIFGCILFLSILIALQSTALTLVDADAGSDTEIQALHTAAATRANTKASDDNRMLRSELDAITGPDTEIMKRLIADRIKAEDRLRSARLKHTERLSGAQYAQRQKESLADLEAEKARLLETEREVADSNKIEARLAWEQASPKTMQAPMLLYKGELFFIAPDTSGANSNVRIQRDGEHSRVTPIVGRGLRSTADVMLYLKSHHPVIESTVCYLFIAADSISLYRELLPLILKSGYDYNVSAVISNNGHFMFSRIRTLTSQ